MKKLLIVGNIQQFMATEKNILNRADIKIFTAQSGEKALEIHRTERVDLIITELDMPGISGDKLCSLIRKDEELKHVSIIISVYRCRSGYREGLQMQGELIYGETHTS